MDSLSYQISGIAVRFGIGRMRDTRDLAKADGVHRLPRALIAAQLRYDYRGVPGF